MCGICGLYDPAGVSATTLQAMLQTIAHRGPDEEGQHIDGVVGIGNRRLSIIDLPTGHQPIANEDHTVWVVFNGEIYNYRQLRHDLEVRGHQFRSHSDTEVIVHLYEEYGERCVEHLGGMFAFAIWDSRAHKLLLARDRLGQKPLYYAYDGETFLFGSEIKAVLAARTAPREMNLEALHNYLSLRFIPAPLTMFKGIAKLPAAHILVYQAGQVRIQRYWHLSFAHKLRLSEAEYLARLEAKLTEAVESHLISDVPLGAFLSGGMDSSMVVALMSRTGAAGTNTFAVGVTEQTFNELPYARQVAEYCGTHHVETCVDADITGLLPHMIWHLDEPSDPIAACMYHAARIAAQSVKVVLGGDGGDELFAGFDRYKGVGPLRYYGYIPEILRARVIGAALNRMPENFAYKSLTQKVRWAHQLSFYPDDAERYAQATVFFRFSHSAKQALFSPDLWASVGHMQAGDVIADVYRQAPATTALDRMLYTDIMTRLPEHSLMLTDRMTMAHSLEARSPLLDHELVELLAAYPDHLKIRRGELKYVLRKLGQNYLPPSILKRDKQGFMFPVAYWFRNELADYLRDMLLNSYFVQTGMFQQAAVSQLIEEHQQQRADHHVRLWMLLNLEIWYQLFIRSTQTATMPAV